jgi:predicted alpha/beta superfamily hydrolase
MRRLHGAVLFLIWTTCMAHGILLPEERVQSRHLGESRTIRVYLPPSYAAETRRRYPVLYVHDGQNVFSSAGTNCCFGWGSWELDKTSDRMFAEGQAREIIIVAVDHSRSRYKEYRGAIYPDGGRSRGSRRSAASNDIDNLRFEAYADFLTKELKPKIDRQYRTLKTAASTGVLGSSLGGICSLSLAWERPDVFGLAASLSGSFQIEKRNFLEQVLRPHRGRARRIRLYLDSGTIDYTGDDDGRASTDAVAAELRRIGWKDGKDLLRFTDLTPLSESELQRAGLRRDKWSEAQRSQHNELYWRLRIWRALQFLFPPVR